MARDEKILDLEARLNTCAAEIDHLKLAIAKLRRIQFGRKSEKLDHQIEQLELQLEYLRADEAEAEREMHEADRTRRKSVSRPLPDHLPRKNSMRLALKRAWTAALDCALWATTWRNNWSTCRPACASSAMCGQSWHATAAMPSYRRQRPAGPSSAASPHLACWHTWVGKFADHLPLYRQAVMYARASADLDRALLASWVGAASALLRPLVDAIRRHVLAGAKLHADDTPIPVLAPGNGKIKTARLWTDVRDDRPSGDNTAPAVWFAYTPDSKGIHLQPHLANYKGLLQADANAGFNALYEDGTIQEAACWVHARRKFYGLHEARPSELTTEALRRIGELYAIEAKIRAKPPHERQQARQAEAKPPIEDLERWMRGALEKLSRKSDTSAVILYALNL